jgi:hypothetical protein
MIFTGMPPSAVMLLQAATQLPTVHISTCHRQPHPAAAAATVTTSLQPQPAMLQANSSLSLPAALLQQQSHTCLCPQQLTATMLLLLPHPTEQVVGCQASSSSSIWQVHCQLPHLGLHLQLPQLLQVQHDHIPHQLPLRQLLLVHLTHLCHPHQHHQQQ